jgi:hypothetical protein
VLRSIRVEAGLQRFDENRAFGLAFVDIVFTDNPSEDVIVVFAFAAFTSLYFRYSQFVLPASKSASSSGFPLASLIFIVATGRRSEPMFTPMMLAFRPSARPTAGARQPRKTDPKNIIIQIIARLFPLSVT